MAKMKREERLAAVLELLKVCPRTCAEIEDALDISPIYVHNLLRSLPAGSYHICDWVRQVHAVRKPTWKPVFKAGAGRDVPEPKKPPESRIVRRVAPACGSVALPRTRTVEPWVPMEQCYVRNTGHKDIPSRGVSC